MSWRISSKRGCLMRCATFSLLPVKKLSTHRTSWPCSSSRSQRCDPRKPAPPVTKSFFIDELLLANDAGCGGGMEAVARRTLDGTANDGDTDLRFAQCRPLPD